MAIRSTFHGNHLLVDNNHNNIWFVVELIIKSSIFEHQTGWRKEIPEYKNLFIVNSIVIADSKPINKYKKHVRGNWNSLNTIDIRSNTYNLDDKEPTARDGEDDTEVQDLKKNYETYENWLSNLIWIL